MPKRPAVGPSMPRFFKYAIALSLAAQRGAIDLIGLAQQRVELVVLVLALGCARVLARHLEPHHLRERFDGVRKLEIVVGHEKADRGAVRAAAEAVIEALRRAHGERRRLLAVERAEAFVVAAGALQRDARADDLDDVGAAEQLVDEGLWDSPGHSVALSEPASPTATAGVGTRLRRYSGVSIVRTRALTVLMSTRPAARVLMTPMTLPRSLRLVAPAASMHSAMNVSSSASDNGCGKIGLEDLELGFFLRHEIGAAAVAELRERVFALLDHALDDGLHAGVVERAARIDFALLDAGQVPCAMTLKRALSPLRIAACMSSVRRSLSDMTGKRRISRVDDALWWGFASCASCAASRQPPSCACVLEWVSRRTLGAAARSTHRLSRKHA